MPFYISKSRAKISFKIHFSHLNVGPVQWTLLRAEGFLPITIKSHMVKILIMWSISLDENNNIALVYKMDFNFMFITVAFNQIKHKNMVLSQTLQKKTHKNGFKKPGKITRLERKLLG